MQALKVVLSPHTPVLQPKARKGGTPKEFVSPSTRQNSSLTTPAAQFQLAENNDEAEKRHRRRSRVLELQQRHMSSPATPTDRRRSLPYGGLTNEKLAEHYASCIKLSAENKITSKNAFGLHLIDYMSELLKKKELDNFQVASSTLDASAKIYAGRVDAVHSETYKVLSGLGRGASKDDQAGDGQGQEDAESEEGPPEKKKKRTRACKTIETNIKNITVNKFDLEFEVDPLFEKMAKAFDEGGTRGLLVNHLDCLDGTHELVLDSSTIVTGGDLDTGHREHKGHEQVDLRELRDIYNGLNLEKLQICPAFSDFEFSHWDRDSEETFTSRQQKVAESEHVFDMDADPEPIAGPSGTAMMPDGDGDSFIDDGGSEFGNESHHSDDCGTMLGDGKEAKLVETAIDDMKHGTIGSLMQVLATEPGEYSYFKSDALKMWGGPEHWKPASSKHSSFSATASVAATEKSDVSKKRKQKAPSRVDLKQNIDFDTFTKESRATTTLTKATVEKYTKAKTVLPEDIHYEPEDLFSVFNKPSVKVKRQATSDNMDEAVENYDYDNENDRENFCPEADHNDEDDDEVGVSMGFDMSEGASQDMFSQTSIGGDMSALNQSVFVGDNLVAEPHKVAKIDICYAKTAKRMDVRRLKTAIWDILTKPEENKELDKTEVEDNEGEKEKTKESEPAGKKTAEGVHTFQGLLNNLPDKISKTMSKNLSVPIAFVCLLHLANEKTLKITSDESMSNLQISQDDKR